MVERVDAGECPVTLFCDLSRAFDCVNQVFLLEKLSVYGIRGRALQWIESFLHDRRQCVSLDFCFQNHIKPVSSEYRRNTLGVPQGSILGPVLFLLYVNDLEDACRSDTAHLSLYADDTSITISDRIEENLETQCNDMLGSLYEWFCANGLSLNLKKTNYIVFHNYQKQAPSLNIHINNNEISKVDCNKFLGMRIDEHLSWRGHCEYLISKLNSLIYLFRNLKSILNHEQLVNVYHSMVESRLRYGVIMWGASTKMDDVFKHQKSIIRIIAGVPPTYSCRELFKSLGILTLPGLYVFELCTHIYRVRSTLIVGEAVHHYRTRHRDQFRTPQTKYNISFTAPLSAGPRLYNKLPDYVKEANTINRFKVLLKQYLIQRSIYNVNQHHQDQF